MRPKTSFFSHYKLVRPKHAPQLVLVKVFAMDDKKDADHLTGLYRLCHIRWEGDPPVFGNLRGELKQTPSADALCFNNTHGRHLASMAVLLIGYARLPADCAFGSINEFPCEHRSH